MIDAQHNDWFYEIWGMTSNHETTSAMLTSTLQLIHDAFGRDVHSPSIKLRPRYQSRNLYTLNSRVCQARG